MKYYSFGSVNFGRCFVSAVCSKNKPRRQDDKMFLKLDVIDYYSKTHAFFVVVVRCRPRQTLFIFKKNWYTMQKNEEKEKERKEQEKEDALIPFSVRR